MYSLKNRSAYLAKALKNGKNCQLQDSSVKLYFCDFKQKWQTGLLANKQQKFECSDFCNLTDDKIDENRSFRYPMFIPQKMQDQSCIILLHGLNERSWEKYGCWAEELAYLTGKPVILFPIAFHINRTPADWVNPHQIIPYVKQRMSRCDNPQNLSFANLVLSERLSSTPLRFYASGRETGDNLWQLCNEIESGKHKLLKAGTEIDFFGYSIGVLLAQVMLLSNPGSLFSDSKLFAFCGGSVFSYMNGNSKYIMDAKAFSTIKQYYSEYFLQQKPSKTDLFELPFKYMLDKNRYRLARDNFFYNSQKRVKIISLKKDSVIPTIGIKYALGRDATNRCLTELDFPFQYSHETPFPTGKEIESEVNIAFREVFRTASEFLS